MPVPQRLRAWSNIALRAACLAALLCCPCVRAAGPAAHATYTHLYAFGDSYLDNGAALRVSGSAMSASVPGAQLLPAAPETGLYWQGRWSNGPSAAEQAAALLGVGLDDYAVGGARSGDGNYYAWLDYYSDTGLLGQVRAHIDSLRGQPADRRALYLLAASANDYFQMRDFARAETPQLLARRAAANTAHAVALLAEAGARTVMVSGAYLLDSVPAVASDPHAAAAARSFMQAYDIALGPALAAVTARHPLHLLRFDWAGTMRKMMVQAPQLGLDELRLPCQATLPEPRPACGDAARYLWWDEYHPSRRAHQLIAEAMVKAVSAP